MKASLIAMALPLLSTALAGVTPAIAQQVPAPKSAADMAQPSAKVSMSPEYAAAVARQAYLWGWPMVNQMNRRATVTKAPQPGLMGGILPVAPLGHLAMLHDYIEPAETFVTCPNQDVVYGLGFFDLDKQPVIAQVPDFGDRFWVYAIYDGRTDQFAELGKPYGTKPGYYLLVGPNWKGDVPAGVTAVIRSPTSLANSVPRVFQDDTKEDRAAIQPGINQIAFYPLTEFDGKIKTVDWSKAPTIPAPPSNGKGETKWVVPEKFFDELPEVLETVAPLPGEEALYAQIRQMLAAAERDPAIKKRIVAEAVATENELIKQFFRWEHNGVAAGNGWNRSLNNAAWGIDYFDRTGTARSNMFDNKPNETQYFYTDYDASGGQLEGSKSYSITFAAGQEPPVNGFWSLTLYNEDHLFEPNKLHRFSLGTKNKDLKRNPDGSLTLYASSASPGADKESNWLPAPKGPFSLYIRAYWGKQGILDGSWQPPKIEAVR
jgi:hypothetical protein